MNGKVRPSKKAINQGVKRKAENEGIRRPRMLRGLENLTYAPNELQLPPAEYQRLFEADLQSACDILVEHDVPEHLFADFWKDMQLSAETLLGRQAGRPSRTTWVQICQLLVTKEGVKEEANLRDLPANARSNIKSNVIKYRPLNNGGSNSWRSACGGRHLHLETDGTIKLAWKV